MPAIGSLPVASEAISIFDPASIVLTLASVVCMITVLSMCTCCHRKVKNRDPDDVYGVVNPAAVTISSGEGPASHSVHFRTQSVSQTITERHSQPAGKTNTSNFNASRVSAPGRALPQLPGDLYAAIDKTRKDDIRFVDEIVNPTYESIDPDADSIIDPLYSKVGEPRVAKRERRYDYPVFSGRKAETGLPTQNSGEMLYQSASQIYGPGSEDPYSSITSDSRMISNSVDGDTSSAYDPGYAKVHTNGLDAKRLERTERELDQLYSKIRRNSGDRSASSPVPGPSSLNIPEAASSEPLVEVSHPQVDTQSVTSREPSYRYITVRENADVVRERLRQQGGLGPPVREHYYSTIGNEYETVGDGNSSSSYSQLNSVPNQALSNSLIDQEHTSLSVTNRELVPHPPTSPIPDRNSVKSNEVFGSSSNETFLGVTTTSSLRLTPPVTSTVSNTQNGFRVNDGLERTEEANGATYTLVTKPVRNGNEKATASRSFTTTFDAAPVMGPGNETSGSVTSFGSWNAPSLSTATSFAGLQRPYSSSNTITTNLIAPAQDRRSASPLATVQGIQEFMQKPTLPYNEDTIIGRKITEERETIIENRISTTTSQAPDNPFPSEVLSRSFESTFLNDRAPATERVYHVEIKKIDGPSANDIISARRIRSSSQSNVSTYPSLDSSRNALHPLNLSSQNSQPGPSSPFNNADTTVLIPKQVQTSLPLTEEQDGAYPPSTARSRSSTRSALPVPMNGEEVKRLADRSRQRRQESIEREELEKKANQQPSGRGLERSSERKKPWKVETEEEKKQRLGTIYTANDYVSTIDMGTARPWPMMGSSSPPSLRKESSTSRVNQEEEDNNNVKSAREQLLKTEPVMFSWDLSECSSLNEELLQGETSPTSTGKSGSCQDPLCFCHSRSPRSLVLRGNRKEMTKLNWGKPIDDD
ncbi:unnamed protein product [Auanema sp. JU1783]|nr:unnamed protein product [Auanema sp. JU1783]